MGGPTDQQKPVIGQQAYIPTQLYMTHGEDDFLGGLATIKSVGEGDGCNVLVEFEEQLGSHWNWPYLLAHQDEWRETYGERRAEPFPDHRPEFNQSD